MTTNAIPRANATPDAKASQSGEKASCQPAIYPVPGSDARQGIVRIDQGWLITFADLMALLLSFFVMLYGMSVMQTEAWQSIVSSLSDELSAGHDTALIRQVPQQTPLRQVRTEGESLTYLQTILVEKFRNDPVLVQLVIRREGGRLSALFPSDLLFGSRSHTILPERQLAIAILAEALRDISNRVEVHATIAVGHTEDRNAAFDHGWYWRLGIARASAMVAALKKAGLRRTILPYGHVMAGEGPAVGQLALVIHEDR